MQLPAPASSLAVPPPAASTAQSVDLSAGAAILEDPGPAADGAAAFASTRAGFLLDSRCLLIFIYRRLCSGRGGTLNTSILEVAALHMMSFSPCCVCHNMHRFFLFLISAFSLLLLLFCFVAIFRRYFVCMCSYIGSDAAMYEVLLFLLYPAYMSVTECSLFCFVELDGCEHDECNHTTTASSDPRFT